MADILIFFCLHSSQTNLVLEFKDQKSYFTLNEASQANLNADKRILKCQPFLYQVYLSSLSLHLHVFKDVLLSCLLNLF